MRSIFLGLIALIFGVSGAEARSWGFEKDTVYEWRPGGDTVRLTNNGESTLQLDSIVIESLNNQEWGNLSLRYISEPSQQGHLIFNQYANPAVKLDPNQMGTGEYIEFQDFTIADFAPTAKANVASLSPGDTILARLRIKSTASEEDTLVVRGTYDVPNALHAPSVPAHLDPKSAKYDALGRASSRGNRTRPLNPSGGIIKAGASNEKKPLNK